MIRLNSLIPVWFILLGFNVYGQVVEAHNNPYFPVISGVNGRLGFIDIRGNLVLPYKLPVSTDRLDILFRKHVFSENMVLIAETKQFPGGKDVFYGYADKTGRIVIEPFTRIARPFSDGYAYVYSTRNGDQDEATYINKNKEIVFELPDRVTFPLEEVDFYYVHYFYSQNDFSDKVAIIKGENGYGFINTKGRIAVKPKFEKVRKFSDQMAAISINGKWGFINNRGRIVVPAKYENVGNFSEGLAAVQLDNHRLGFINKLGKLVLRTKYLFIDHNGMFTPTYRWNTNIINKGADGSGGDDATNAVPHYLEEAVHLYELSQSDMGRFENPRYSEGLYPVTKDFKTWGFIDKRGKLVIPFEYHSVGNFSEGVAKVRKAAEYYFINKKGNSLFNKKYKFVGDFSNGLALVFFKWESEIIDCPGPAIKTEYLEETYDDASQDNIIYGYIDKSGKHIYLDNYNFLECFESFGDGSEQFFTDIHIADLEVKSNPTGAKIFLVPFTVWDFDENMINDSHALEKYRQSTDTNTLLSVMEQVYMVVVESKTKREKRKINVIKNSRNIVEVNFENE